jgi:glycosyltransferase involved in cell wall biosynthesis
VNILLLAPEPFFQERGTPIAIKLLAETLCEQNNNVDLLTYHEGVDISIKGLRILRIPKIPFIKKVPIGFSFRKFITDIIFALSLFAVLFINDYDVLHAVEESIFPAAFLNIFWKKKLIYDMDSSLIEQMCEKWKFLIHFEKFLNIFEKWAIKRSDIIVPVCNYLAEKAKHYKSKDKVYILTDIAFESKEPIEQVDNIREQFNLTGVVALYVGNLEHYQGIDLMLESLTLIDSNLNFSLVIIGGSPDNVSKYKKKVKELNITDKVFFAGHKPFANLQFYLEQADILLSPRIKGKNTPMKIFSYLSSGKTILATNIDSHTQVLDSSCAYLVNPEAKNFSIGLHELIDNKELREKLGKCGRELAEKNYSRNSYKKKVEGIYSDIAIYHDFMSNSHLSGPHTNH